MSGKVAEEAVNPCALPWEAQHVWAWFCALAQSRQQGMAGPMPISEWEMRGYFVNRGITPAVWEIDAIKALDALALEAAAGDGAGKRG